ncbi:protein phosphatase 2C, putative [Trypanosoma brucei gambiense DAL972]|uniref:protein-serine/threonine phosphatase n=2 Tax=Trypanosoma brucei TaxID=5691 RepID=Q381U4_TRYB2|nr:protein phosphatase 2C, putative [Trypanosoma brucei gambiense DAL972]XP_829549.1 protein phosphatase 2C, putative [Trypanosoma brucei brucei TREU927]EAN80437.1 protein phosphatase 2C, putative [Trypanosoma brucei brucei TREU927]CBH18552.1 protein phosphatase 2C, putative [Trypanosoma brucei gambiense DAL972]|eukprot:XP_011780816.1 protein phosphatase 2C, putative [Trypanosoma brucei gambiense DAL972]
MKGAMPPRQPPVRPCVVPRASIARAFAAFAVSIVASYLVGTKMGPITVIITLALFLFGSFNLLRHALNLVVVNANEANYNNMLRRADLMQHPSNQKFSDCGENAWVSFGFSCMQGWRRAMEDDHVTLLTCDGGFFGVFDGHSGANVAKFCGGNIFGFISQTEAYKNGNYSRAIYDGFMTIDKHIYSNFKDEKSGCTAVVLFVKGDNLYCGNAGDSRSVLCSDGEPVPLSTDHKPFLPTEQTRIERAGGYVWNRRVNGALALSRAIGDFSFKSNTLVPWDQQAVTSAPEVHRTLLDRTRDEFAVVACDGIWDVLSNEQVVRFVRLRIQRQVPLDKIAEELLDHCLSPHPFGVGCDNMSVVIVKFKQSPPVSPEEEFNVPAADVAESPEQLPLLSPASDGGGRDFREENRRVGSNVTETNSLLVAEDGEES